MQCVSTIPIEIDTIVYVNSWNLWNSLGHWILFHVSEERHKFTFTDPCQFSMGIVDAHCIDYYFNVQEKFARFWQSFFEYIDYVEKLQGDERSNYQKDLLLAVYIQSMITRPLCEKLLMIKSVKCFFLHLLLLKSVGLTKDYSFISYFSAVYSNHLVIPWSLVIPEYKRKFIVFFSQTHWVHSIFWNLKMYYFITYWPLFLWMLMRWTTIFR